MADNPVDYSLLYDSTGGGDEEFSLLPIPSGRVIYPIEIDLSSKIQSDTNLPTKETDKAKQETTPQGWGTAMSLVPTDSYMLVRLPGRGENGEPLTFRWLVNPSTIRVGYKTVDAQSMVRSGWMYGVWGDDVVEISMEGQSAGYYFTYGLTEKLKKFSYSYRNLLMMQNVFLNNGYWFEGESLGSFSTSPTDFTRTKIQYHEDIQLMYNNFIWKGMFTSISIESSSEHPYWDKFSLGFVAWKERYRNSSPWIDSIHNDVERGHSRGIWSTYGNHDKQSLTKAGDSPVASLPTNPVNNDISGIGSLVPKKVGG